MATYLAKVHPVAECPWRTGRLDRCPDLQPYTGSVPHIWGAAGSTPFSEPATPRTVWTKQQVYRIRRLVNPSDEMIDLTEDQQRWAKDADSAPAQGYGRWPRDATPCRSDLGQAVPDIRHTLAMLGMGFFSLYPLQEQDMDGADHLWASASSFPAADSDTPDRVFCEHRLLAGGDGDLNLAEVWRHLEEDTRVANVPWKGAASRSSRWAAELLSRLGDSLQEPNAHTPRLGESVRDCRMSPTRAV